MICIIGLTFDFVAPISRTTEAPVLSPSHPLRRGFARYGRHASRLAVTTLLISAAVATVLIYPIPFLFTTDFINGASNLPHHVWTVAQPLPYDVNAVPDIVMRSIWIHASYMQALSTEILSSALELQDELLGVTQDFGPSRSSGVPLPDDSRYDHLTPAQRDALHVVNGLTNQSWIFQSPLLYWNCSRERILADHDILSTVNDKKNQSTPANITLRHSIVFSGKRFEDRRLLAADALVITLLHLRDSPVGRQWETTAPSLPGKVGDKWDIYPPDGRVSASQLYEFQFRPISMQDSIVLAVAYALTLLYFLISLSKLRAVKSKFGLIVTVMTQIFLSIMSSFTICAIFNIDLSRIPRAAYPLVILSMSLENIFRLINAVILTPSEDNTSNRIGHAFGETAHTALASTVQNVLILMGMSCLVSPGVSAFCIFAAVAIVFDFFFLSTFFLSVLSVDVRRMELGDALAKESMRHNRNFNEARGGSSWVRQVLRGKIALSTRIAGTIVMIGFVLIAQSHFFGGEDIFQQMLRLYKGPDMKHHAKSPKTSLLEDIHQARSPTSWLRLQDHDTTREIIRIIKPSAYSYIARVHEPLVFVKKGSDRIPHRKEPTLLPAAYDFIHHQLGTFIVIVIVVVAALRLLTSYLLLENETKTDDQHESNECPSLSVKTLSGAHTLDIAKLANSSGGQMVSVGLDRVIHVWDIKGGGQGYPITSTKNGDGDLFPVLAMAIDDESQWLAILSSSHVAFWNLSDRSWGPSVSVDSYNSKPEAFFFENRASSGSLKLIMVWRHGTLTEVEVTSGGGGGGGGGSREFALCPRLLSARPLVSKDNHHPRSRLSVVSASRQGNINVISRSESSWESRNLSISRLINAGVYQVVPLSPLAHFLAASVEHVYLVSAEDGSILHTFKVERMQPRSLECAYSCHRSSNARSIGLTSFTFCYMSAESGDCVLHNFAPQDEDDAIFLEDTADGTISGWCTWEGAKETKKHVGNPGVWGISSDGSVVGLRRSPQADYGIKKDATTNVRNRFQGRDRTKDTFRCWEVWRASTGDRVAEDESRPLFVDNEQAEHLIISELGPKVKIGLMSVAFAFGNVIKLVTVGGHERFEAGSDEASHESPMNVSGRRRKLGGATRPRASS